MHSPDAVTPLSPAPSSSSATAKPASWLERHVGEMVAGAAGTIALALSEFNDGALTPRTKMQGGDAIAKLYKLRQFMIGTWDFDRIAREHGRAVLRECCGNNVKDATVDALVSEALAILAKVVRDQLN